jgi:hypothetical protein
VPFALYFLLSFFRFSSVFQEFSGGNDNITKEQLLGLCEALGAKVAFFHLALFTFFFGVALARGSTFQRPRQNH